MGPSAIISLLTYQTVSHVDAPLEHAIFLCFLAGVIELIMGIFGLGKYLYNIYYLLTIHDKNIPDKRNS